MGKRLTTEEFIERTKNIHGDKYDYSLMEYVNIETKIKIICPIHGMFEQRPIHHLNGTGCPTCSIEKKRRKNIISDFEKVHNKIYDYSLVVFEGMHKKIKIKCSIHGVFEQTPNSHLYGRGCPKCVGVNKTHDDFIRESNIIHDNKYQYPETYNGCYEKIKIICPIHGIFEQTPNSHINGHGCHKCGGVMVNNEKDFIIESSKIHNNFYDYSLVKYEKTKLKVKIICPIHGVFEQRPSDHLKGQGCPKCSGTIKSTTYEFNNTSNKIHNNFYDYSLAVYKNNKKKVKIICPIHGEFKQRPNDHLMGHGCPKCNTSKGEQEIEKILNNLNIKYIKEYKFNDCIVKRHLRFDFYLPNLNICIEFDGKQHYKVIEKFGGEYEFKKRKKYDKIKNEYCKNNNIHLLRIPYTEYNNIEQILTKELKLE